MLELARESDFEAVNVLARQVHELHVSWRPDLYCSTEQPYPMEFFLEDIREKRLFVSRLSDTVVGLVGFCIWESGGPGNTRRKVMRLDKICVDEKFRNMGIGKAMVGDVRALAKAFGCDEVILSVYPQNDAAVAFYQKCGFRIRTINMDMKI